MITSHVYSLARAELLLLRRNTVALLSVIGVPLLGAAVLAGAAGGGEAAAEAIAMLLSLVLLLCVYYNLLAAYVARRQERVLKRLRSSAASDAEVLAGTATPALVVAIVQVCLLAAAGALLLDLPVPVNPPLLVLGMVLGAAIFTALALLTAPWTRTSEAAQFTSMPVILVCMLGAGAVVPLDQLPQRAQDVAAYLPLSPVVELVQLAWLGRPEGGGAGLGFWESTTAAAAPAAIGCAWVVLGAIAARRWFRWEPRS